MCTKTANHKPVSKAFKKWEEVVQSVTNINNTQYNMNVDLTLSTKKKKKITPVMHHYLYQHNVHSYDAATCLWNVWSKKKSLLKKSLLILSVSHTVTKFIQWHCPSKDLCTKHLDLWLWNHTDRVKALVEQDLRPKSWCLFVATFSNVKSLQMIIKY